MGLRAKDIVLSMLARNLGVPPYPSGFFDRANNDAPRMTRVAVVDLDGCVLATGGLGRHKVAILGERHGIRELTTCCVLEDDERNRGKAVCVTGIANHETEAKELRRNRRKERVARPTIVRILKVG